MDTKQIGDITDMTLHVDVDLELGDLLRLCVDNIKARLLIGIGIMLLVGAAVIYFFVSIEKEDMLFEMLTMTSGIIAVVIVGRLAQVYFECRKYFAKLKNNERHIHYQFQVDGCDVLRGKNFGHIAWESIVKAQEKPLYFQLCFDNLSGCVIPKRCLESGAKIQGLRALLSSQLGERAKLMND